MRSKITITIYLRRVGLKNERTFQLYTISTMDSDMDAHYLKSRVRQLESEVDTLKMRNAKLKEENDAIFYKWTKTDFVTILETYISDNEQASLSEEDKEQLWNLWKQEFPKRYCAAESFATMGILMADVIKEFKNGSA